MYRVKYSPFFEKRMKEFRKDKEVVTELKKKIEKLLSDPFIGKPLQYRLANYRSIRVRDKYRLIYKINDNDKEVVLEGFGHRKNIYDIMLFYARG